MATLQTDSESRDVVFFDGVCLFCRRWVNFVLRHDRDRVYALAWLQSVAARRRLDDTLRADLDSVVLLRAGRCYRKSAAVLRIVSGLGGIWRLAALLLVVPAPLRDACYDLVGNRRYRWFGRLATCELPPVGIADRFVRDGNVVDAGPQSAAK
jgi:predicted DCC family thiol-disulfide oxidoreductase YuxK